MFGLQNTDPAKKRQNSVNIVSKYSWLKYLAIVAGLIMFAVIFISSFFAASNAIGDKACYAAEYSQESLRDYTLGEPTRSEDGFLAYPIDSKYEQEGADLRILLPEKYSKRGRFNRFLFVLPVSRKEAYHHGNGLDEIRKLDLHNKYKSYSDCPVFCEDSLVHQ